MFSCYDLQQHVEEGLDNLHGSVSYIVQKEKLLQKEKILRNENLLQKEQLEGKQSQASSPRTSENKDMHTLERIRACSF